MYFYINRGGKWELGFPVNSSKNKNNSATILHGERQGTVSASLTGVNLVLLVHQSSRGG